MFALTGDVKWSIEHQLCLIVPNSTVATYSSELKKLVKVIRLVISAEPCYTVQEVKPGYKHKMQGPIK